jgi:hypothetical protein
MFTAGGKPNFRNEAPQEMTVLSVFLLFVSFCCVGTLLTGHCSRAE